MLSLFIGVVTTSMQEATTKMREEMEIAEIVKSIQQIYGVEDHEVDEWKDVFNKFDADDSGSIDDDELGTIMEVLGMKLSKVELKKMMAKVDTDGGGDVNFSEFVHMIVEHQIETGMRDPPKKDTETEDDAQIEPKSKEDTTQGADVPDDQETVLPEQIKSPVRKNQVAPLPNKQETQQQKP